MIFFTADTHFFHKNVIRYCNRPFSSVAEMNDILIQNWNSVVNPGDIVYHLGDFAHCCKPHEAIAIRKQLNGQIIMIRGSHDHHMSFLAPYLTNVHTVLTAKFYDKPEMEITLSHHPFLSWPKCHYGTWHLFGHHHGNLRLPAEIMGKSFDCGVDCWDYKPISYDQVVAAMEPLHNGFNFIPLDRRRKSA